MTVRMLQSYKRNRPGDVCGFTPEEEEMLVEQGAACFVEPKKAEAKPVEEPEPAPEPEPEVVEPEEADEPEKSLEDLPYPKLKEAAYKKAAERGDDLGELLPDIRTPTLLGYLQDE